MPCILTNLEKHGRLFSEDLPKPILKSEMLKIKDQKPQLHINLGKSE